AFIALWIFMYIIIRVLFMVLKKLVATTYIGYYLNKVLGGVLGVIITAILVLGFMTIVRLLGNYEVIIPVNQMIEDSSVSKMIYDNNFLYNFISNKVDIQSTIDKIMEAIGAIS
ncbi:MAG: CvpA family protein, partial [Bacillota bacterium]